MTKTDKRLWALDELHAIEKNMRWPPWRSGKKKKTMTLAYYSEHILAPAARAELVDEAKRRGLSDEGAEAFADWGMIHPVDAEQLLFGDGWEYFGEWKDRA